MVIKESRFHWLIDNGHDSQQKGKQSPVWNNGKVLDEYIYNRKIALNLFILLENSNIDYTELVPDVNKRIRLKKRSRRANKLNKLIRKSTAFLSIHGNASFRYPEANGIETYHYKGSDKGLSFAEIFQRELIKETGWRNRGVKTANFHVLRETTMPAVLTENGFYTNYNECMKMLDPLWQRRIAYAHYKAILEIEKMYL